MPASETIHKLREFSKDPAHPQVMDSLIQKLAGKKVVMLGEASHGTHEFYTWRTAISQRLIKEHGFSFIAVEGDWVDCYEINRFIRNYPGSPKSAAEVLDHFNRWPSWMWGNWEIAALAESLHTLNLTTDQHVGFYGLDVYGLWETLEAILIHLKKKDQDILKAAMQAIRCFEPYRDDDGTSYAYSTTWLPEGCKEEVLALMSNIKRKNNYRDSDLEADFFTEQSARVIRNAEAYYRSMVKGDTASWNVRDQHMAESLDHLLSFHGPDAKAIVWAHNTHIGDARYTDMKSVGMVNIGQLAREKYGHETVFLLGMGTHTGTVTAGDTWNDPYKTMRIPEAPAGSWENLLHQTGYKRSVLFANDLKKIKELKNNIGHRAIGVVYEPAREQLGNFVPSQIINRYDGFIFIDQTTALHPMHHESGTKRVPDTYPFGV